MDRRKFWSNLSLKNILIIFSTLFFSVGIIVYFLPHEKKFGYEYEVGKPWHYAPLIAPYDFPVYKSDAQMAAERDSVIKDFEPFFTYNQAVAERQIEALRNEFTTGQLRIYSHFYFDYLAQKLSEVYAAGVVSTEDYGLLQRDGSTAIRAILGKAAIGKKVEDIYSTREAYEYIMNVDTAQYSREALLRCNINDYLVPNLLYDSVKTRQQLNDLLSAISMASGMVQSGQRIIDRGEIIKESQLHILSSLELESQRRNDPSRDLWQLILGQTIFVLTVFLLFIIYLRLFRRDILTSTQSILLLFSLMVLFPVIISLMVTHNFGNVYIVPMAILPIFVRIFMDSRTAFVSLVATTLLSSLPLTTSHQFIFIQIVAGMTAIYTLKDLTERAQLLRTALWVTAVSLLSGLAYDLSQGTDITELSTSWYIYICINGALLLFAYPLMYPIERFFGFTSSVSLVELTDIDHPILRQLSKVAQGTFNHSMQVANLAAEVANKIGAKPQLVRTGALYHDIGKMMNPAFFTENQSGVNPHNSLPEERSAEIIIGHVKEGLRLAEKYHLPKVVRDFIVTHHGRSKVKYFYIQYKNNHPGESVNDELFTYPGLNPFTREQAIIMMCDAVEASSRSLKEFTEESIRDLVYRIVDGQMNEGCFRDCPITFRDISEAKEVLVESLKTIHHTRIAYPELKPEQPAKPERPQRTGFFGTGLLLNRPRKD
ncbi:MAG: HDIG domain-containing protein [Bacteroidaceae bacterium]|nr:HDIG domain-containing protein [Bacteroidaceae bacterium]